MEIINLLNRRVRTTKDAGANDWSDEAKAARKWGVTGRVTDRSFSDNRGPNYNVQHDDGTNAWYELRELDILPEEPITLHGCRPDPDEFPNGDMYERSDAYEYL